MPQVVKHRPPALPCKKCMPILNMLILILLQIMITDFYIPWSEHIFCWEQVHNEYHKVTQGVAAVGVDSTATIMAIAAQHLLVLQPL